MNSDQEIIFFVQWLIKTNIIRQIDIRNEPVDYHLTEFRRLYNTPGTGEYNKYFKILNKKQYDNPETRND